MSSVSNVSRLVSTFFVSSSSGAGSAAVDVREIARMINMKAQRSFIVEPVEVFSFC